MRFEDQVVLVTGSSRNMGRRVAERFASEGARVVINAAQSRDELDAATAAMRALGYDVLPVLADLAKPQQVTDLVGRAEEAFGRIDVLVIAHSVRPLQHFLSITAEEWQRVVDVNFTSVYHLAQAVLAPMVERGRGVIIAISGTSGDGPVLLPQEAAGGLEGLNVHPRSHAFTSISARTVLLKTLMREFSRYGIRFNFVSPGIMDTSRVHPDWYPGDDAIPPQHQPHWLRQVPMGRPGDPDELASVVLFLASSEASYVNGATVDVNGGWRM